MSMVVVLVDKEMAAASGVCKRNNNETVVSALSGGIPRPSSVGMYSV
jgi:hypothetical protein